MKENIKLDENYYLISQEVNGNVTVEVAKKTNHIFVVDVSGSMSSELQQIRTQLKNKLSNLMKEGDTISIVWFSGGRDAGILKEEVEVKSLKTLTDLHSAIDRWLRPVGLTAFLKPLELTKDLIGRIKKNRPDSIFSMIFLTDGYNNDCPWNEVIKTLKELENDVVSSTFVEYGYYADSRRLTEMASMLGGEKISCDGFDEFEPIFDAKISLSINGGKKTVVEIQDKYLYDFAFSVTNGSVLLYNVQDGKIMINSDVKKIHFFSSNKIGTEGQITNNIIDNPDTALYAAIYILADKLMNEMAEKIFYQLGDNYYYKMLVNAFGKQKLNSFKSAIKECITDGAKRFPEGKVQIEKVSDNAYCLMNLIEDLGDIENCLFYPSHSDFIYNRIGRKKVATGSILTEADKKRLTEAKDVSEASAILKELEEKKVEVKFVNSNPNRGYSLTDLVWNEERANLSVRIYIEGEVILPENKFKIDKVSSFKYNTFTIIKDGILNVNKLPVNWSSEIQAILTTNNIKHRVTDYNTETNAPEVVVIDLSSLPIINRGMVKAISANDLAKLEWNLIKIQGDKKVYDHYKKQLFPKVSKSFIEMLGENEAAWLKEIGITDFNGFAPKTNFEVSTDFYMSVNLATKIKGLSSLPKVDDVVAKIKAGKELKLNEWVMADAIKNYLAQLESDIYKTLPEEQQRDVLKTYLETKFVTLNKQKRGILQEIAQIKFALILSKRWFSEFKSFDENKLSLTLDGQNLDFTFDLSEKEEKI